MPVEHTLEQLTAGALGNRVVDDERGVDVLAAAGEEGARQIDLTAGAGEEDADLIARQRRAGSEVETAIVGIGAEIDEPVGQMHAAAGFEGAFHVRDGRTGADDDLGRRVELELLGSRRRRHMRLDDRRLGAVADAHEVARGDEQRIVARAQRHQQHRLLQLGVGGDVDYGAVTGVRRVERQHGVVVAVADTQQLRRGLVIGENRGQRGDGDRAVGHQRREVGCI